MLLATLQGETMQIYLISYVLDSSMEDTEAMDSRPPLAALSPSRQNTEAAGNVDFSKLSPSQFGISTDSFLSSSKIKDKSRVAQLKARRRSTIGVRGSPETNSLICFRARQAAKTPPRTPQLLQGSPFLSRCDSLKKKMAAFQCLMEEDDEEDEQKKNEENESAKSTLAKDSENGKLSMQSPFTSMTPPPSKKRCWAPPGECKDKITKTPLPYPTFTTQQEQGVKCSESQTQRPLSGVDSDAKNELLSLPMLSKPDVKPADENMGSAIHKKKRVRFGAPLSPEFFDKTLPPSTPLQKGGTPMCLPSSTGPKRSLLKTPQRCEAPLPQPDFNSPQNNGASPVLVIDRHSSGLLYSDEVFEEIKKISFPSMEEESPSHKPSENCKVVDALSAEDPGQPQAEDAEVMNAAFQEEEDEPSNSQTEEKLPYPTGDQPLALSIVVDQDSESSSNSSTEPARSRCRKRKQPGESEPEKRRSSRTAAASASGKMKTPGVKRRFGNKEVDRSLYGKRDYASKNPLLSPIFEMMSTSLNNTPTQTQSGKLTDGEQDSNQTPNVPHSKTVCPMVILGTSCTRTNENEQALCSTVTNTTDNQSDMNSTCLEPSVGTRRPAGRISSGTKTSKAKLDSGRPERQRRSSGGAKRKELGNIAINFTTTESDCETGEQDTESQKPTESAGLSPMYQDSSDRPVHEAECSENKKIEVLNSCVVQNENSVTTERLEQKTPGNKRRGRVQKALKSPCVKIDVVVEEVDESGQSERNTVDASESNTAPTEPSLAPWQKPDFNIDDILKPVAKSRGSVRRSLRNRRSVDLQAVGLTWVDHTSPELSKAGRRRTRGRLSGVSEPLVFQASEELTPNLGE
ncbi:cell division cycle-associated protein 2 isoform X3 [Megalobrama amblycephala]|uniref:cell division cycle-associated protein 2 isoform X3 n=1 Tax=Megalobrama amblycephala TaxID=75352 RepID=UPI002013C70D|nr:cell division cycle-associated protein 2 isoform X3 [Megalobrama amblycephala]